MGAHWMTQDSRGGQYVDAVEFARGRSHEIPSLSDQEAHESRGKRLGCERGFGGTFSGESVVPMFVDVSVVLVATWMAGTVFCKACLAIYLRVKLLCHEQSLPT